MIIIRDIWSKWRLRSGSGGDTGVVRVRRRVGVGNRSYLMFFPSAQ